MKKIFTLLVSVFAITFAMAQNNQTGVFGKATVAPVIDGVVDQVWSEANVYNIDRVVGADTPTIGAPGESTWQALWTMDGVYVLLKIADDSFFPNYAPGGGPNSWEYDKPELYFDVNSNLMDGGGPGSPTAALIPGHYQFAPGFTEGKNDGTPITDSGNGVVHAFMVTGSNYICEYFIPMTVLKDAAKAIVDKTATIGFDVIFIDRDLSTNARNQAVWSNTVASYSNMDQAGHVTFANAEADVYIDQIALTGGAITQNKGTLQIAAKITPADATYKDLVWSVVNGTGKATIDQKGVLTGLTDGTVTITAKSTDVQGMDASVEVVISGQTLSRTDIWNSFNLIKNWNFDTNITSWINSFDGAGQMAAVVADGVVAFTTVVGVNGENWHFQFNQTLLNAEANVPYVFTFKSWSDAERLNDVDFEDGPNGNNRYGISSDAESSTGRGDWRYTTTTNPKWFVFHVTFDQMKATTVQKVLWLESQAVGTAYLDSVLLITQAEYDKLATLPATAAKTIANSINKVYPNPVGNDNSLFVELSSVNAKVAIYNAVGQKMMEKVATGKLAKFDVSSLRQGIYFVKLGDGSIQKFIR